MLLEFRKVSPLDPCKPKRLKANPELKELPNVAPRAGAVSPVRTRDELRNAAFVESDAFVPNRDFTGAAELPNELRRLESARVWETTFLFADMAPLFAATAPDEAFPAAGLAGERFAPNDRHTPSPLAIARRDGATPLAPRVPLNPPGRITRDPG